MLIPCNRAGLRIIDCYFEELPGSEDCTADLLRCHQMERPMAGAPCTPFGTLTIDLSRTPDEILAGMKGDTRRLIRKAEREGVTWEAADGSDAAVRDRLANFFDRCRQLKHLPPVSRSLLCRLAAYRALGLSLVRGEDGEVLAANSYIVTPIRARSLYTAAIFREAEDSSRKSLIARAGRFMWWSDMLQFQRQGQSLFDFGGFYLGHNDQEKLRVNAYKAEFGGELRQEFNCEQGLTVKGKLALWALSQMRSRQERQHSHRRLPAEVFN